jgi:hypothetical protein
MGLTTFPSGSTRTKNCFVGLVSVRCSERFLPMAMSSLTIPEPAGPLRLQLRSRRRLWSKGSKPYCYKLMRLNVPIGCMINARDAASPANAQLGRGSVSSCSDIKTTTHNRKSSVGFAAVPEVQRSRVESSADATSANVGEPNGSPVRPGRLSLLNFKLTPLRFAKRETVILQPVNSSPKLYHQLGDANRVCLDLLCHFPRRSLRAKRQLLSVECIHLHQISMG